MSDTGSSAKRDVTPEFREMVVMWIEKYPLEAADTLIEHLGVDFIVYGSDGGGSGEDMSNPRNWKAGDVVECVRDRPSLTLGNCYSLMLTESGYACDEDEDVLVIDDDGDDIHFDVRCFNWVARPKSGAQKTPP